jgi:hypothetical protein
MSWDLLQRFLESDVFNSNPFLPVSYLSRYADHVGIHYVLCNKLRQFPYEDIEFFLPQLCHLIISVDNESMALEEFLMDLCEESVTAALLTFWLFQTYLHDLASNPQSNAFQTCRRVYNKVQHIVFGLADTARHDKIKENVLPVTVLSSFVLASVALPMIPQWAGPLAVAQARKPKPDTELQLETKDKDFAKPLRARTVTSSSSKPKRGKEGRITQDRASEGRPRSSKGKPSVPVSLPSSSVGSPKASASTESKKPTPFDMQSIEARLSSASLPLPSPQLNATRPTTPLSVRNDSFRRRHSGHHKETINLGDLSESRKVGLLRQHYFRTQTQFLTALEGISNRLVIVPKPARMSALRAELALISQDLPAEVDIPVICPPTLVEGSPSKSCHHRIVRLNPAESTVLNSAEKVPYLMMVEVLRDDFTFDPETTDNARLLNLLVNEGGSSRRLFDLSSESPKILHQASSPTEPIIDSVFEPTSGDLGSSPLLKPSEDEQAAKIPPKSIASQSIQRLSSGATTSTTALDVATPRTSGQSNSRSSSPGPRKMTISMPPYRSRGRSARFLGTSNAYARGFSNACAVGGYQRQTAKTRGGCNQVENHCQHAKS